MNNRLLAVTAVLLSAATAYSADHFDAPALDGMGQLDVADLYAF